LKSSVVLPDNKTEAIPKPLAGKWCLMGGTTTRLEVNLDGSGSIEGSMWGREPVEWSIAENRLCVTVERGSGSAKYAINDNNELVLSKVQGLFILVAGTYMPADARIKHNDPEMIIW